MTTKVHNQRAQRSYYRCVAAPIVDHTGETIGGVSISALIYHFPDERIPEFSQLIRETAMEISRKLGYLGV